MLRIVAASLFFCVRTIIKIVGIHGEDKTMDADRSLVGNPFAGVTKKLNTALDGFIKSGVSSHGMFHGWNGFFDDVYATVRDAKASGDLFQLLRAHDLPSDWCLVVGDMNNTAGRAISHGMYTAEYIPGDNVCPGHDENGLSCLDVTIPRQYGNGSYVVHLSDKDMEAGRSRASVVDTLSDGTSFYDFEFDLDAEYVTQDASSGDLYTVSGRNIINDVAAADYYHKAYLEHAKSIGDETPSLKGDSFRALKPGDELITLHGVPESYLGNATGTTPGISRISSPSGRNFDNPVHLALMSKPGMLDDPSLEMFASQVGYTTFEFSGGPEKVTPTKSEHGGLVDYSYGAQGSGAKFDVTLCANKHYPIVLYDANRGWYQSKASISGREVIDRMVRAMAMDTAFSNAALNLAMDGIGVNTTKPEVTTSRVSRKDPDFVASPDAVELVGFSL